MVGALHELRQRGEPVRVRAVHARHLQPVSLNQDSQACSVGRRSEVR